MLAVTKLSHCVWTEMEPPCLDLGGATAAQQETESAEKLFTLGPISVECMVSRFSRPYLRVECSFIQNSHTLFHLTLSSSPLLISLNQKTPFSQDSSFSINEFLELFKQHMKWW